MNEINHFKVFVFSSGDVATDVDHLHVKRIQLVSFSYIVIKDYITSYLVLPMLLFTCYSKDELAGDK
jgi:hypothetical protein